MTTPIKTYSLADLESLVHELGQPKFRAQQLADWLYVHHVRDYDEMTNLPASFRALLRDRYPLYTPQCVERLISQDGTRKYVFELHDGACVETVAIPSREGNRLTVCFSTQVGCPMACAFCATGKEGFVRNLLPGEIVDQVLLAQEDCGARVTNVVGMGQGEPFLNYDKVLASLRILNNQKGIALGARHISVSTCGILPGIKQFANEPEQFTLAVSLHSARQDIRDMLMPKTSKYDLKSLKTALQDYVEKTNRRVTLEYIMIDGVNDSNDDLTALLNFCSHLHCHVNLIPINKVSGSAFQPSSPKTLANWATVIHARGVETTIRDSRGSDIAGACGQLKQTIASKHS